MNRIAVEDITTGDMPWSTYSAIKDMTSYTVTVEEIGPRVEYVAYRRDGSPVNDVELHDELIEAVKEFRKGEN